MNELARWFLEPGALAWALALPVLVALWMLRLRREPLVVPSTLLWERLLADRHVNRPLERLRRNLLLLLQLVLLGLLAAALMRPFKRGSAVSAERVILVVDATASMQATDVAPSRFARARADALERLAALPAECEAMLIAAGPHPAVAAPFTRDRALLTSRLAALEPADAGGNLSEALGLAAELARPRGGAPTRVWVFSDGGVVSSTTRGVALDPAQVSFFRTGGAADNLAVVQLSARRVGARPADYEVFAQVASFARTARSVAADLLRDGRLVDSRQITLGAGERAAVVFSGSYAGAARLTVALQAADALALDDRAYAALPAAVTRRVTLVGDADPWLEKALTLLPGVEVLEPRTAGRERGEVARAPGLTIAVGAIPTPWPAGPVWLIAPAATSPAATVAGSMDAPAVVDSDASHPVLADVALARARIDGGVRLAPAAGLATLVNGVAGSLEAPLLAAGELEVAGGRPVRTVVMAFRPGASDLPLRAALPLLVANVVDWAFEPEERGVAIRAGAPLPLRPGEELTVRDPAGEVELVEAGGRGVTAERVGFWTLEAKGGARTVAVNLSDAGESDLAPGPGPALGGRALADLAGTAETDRELSRELLMLVFVLLVLEWVVHHRRWAA